MSLFSNRSPRILAVLSLTIFTAICFANPVKSLVAKHGTETVENQPPTAEDYIQDGLIAIWDGIENADWGIHDPSATGWMNLVDGKMASVIGTYEYPKPIVGDSFMFFPQRAVYWYSNNTFPYSGRVTTIEAVFALEVEPGPYEYFSVIQPSKSTGFKLVVCSDENGSLRIPLEYTKGKALSIPGGGIPVSVSIRYKNGRCYGIDTTYTVTDTTTGGYGYNYGQTNIGYGFSSNNFKDTTRSFEGRIYCIRLYNRVLSEYEIAYNLSIDKARFDLP